MSPNEFSWTPWEASFRQEMRRLRELAGMSQTELAKRVSATGLAFHQQTVNKIESGERSVRLNEAFAIADALRSDLRMMTSGWMEPTERDARLTVARLISVTEGVEEYLGEVYDRWLTEFEMVVSVLDDVAEQDDALPWVHWLAAHAIKAQLVDTAISQMSRTLIHLSGAPREPVDPSAPSSRVQQLRKTARAFLYAPEQLNPERLAALPRQLLDRLLDEVE